MGLSKTFIGFLVVVCLTSLLTRASYGQTTTEDQPTSDQISGGLGPQDFTDAELEEIQALENAQDGDPIPPNVQKYIEEYFDEEDRKLEEEEVEPNPASMHRAKRQAYGYGPDNKKLLTQLAGKLSTGDSSYGSHSGGHGGHGGYHPPKGYVPQTLDYGKSTSKSPLISFVKSYKPGKTYIDKGSVVRNYYRHGNYQVALQHYKLIPTVKVVPFTSYHKIPYKGEIQAKHKYQARVCKDCYHGKTKIDVYEEKAPYSYSVRRFVYVPKKYDKPSYGYDHQPSYGYDKPSYGYDKPSYGYDKPSYGYDKPSYGYEQPSYGHEQSSYGYDKPSYGYDSYKQPSYGYDSYSYEKPSYGYGDSTYGSKSSGYGHDDHRSGYGYPEYGTAGYSDGYKTYGHPQVSYHQVSSHGGYDK